MNAVISFRTSEYIAEASPLPVHIEFVDGSGVPIDNAAISAITATLINHVGAAVFTNLDVKDDNGGVLSAGGIFDLELSATHTVALVGGPDYQQRYLTVLMTHSGGKPFPVELQFFVRKIHGYGV